MMLKPTYQLIRERKMLKTVNRKGAHRVARSWVKITGLLLLVTFLCGVAVQYGVRP